MLFDGRGLCGAKSLDALIVVAVLWVLWSRREVQHGKANRPIGIQWSAFQVIRPDDGAAKFGQIRRAGRRIGHLLGLPLRYKDYGPLAPDAEGQRTVGG